MADISILVVDDSSTMRRIVKKTLEKFGFTNVEEAENGGLFLEVTVSPRSSE